MRFQYRYHPLSRLSPWRMRFYVGYKFTVSGFLATGYRPLATFSHRQVRQGSPDAQGSQITHLQWNAAIIHYRVYPSSGCGSMSDISLRFRFSWLQATGHWLLISH